MVNNLYEKINNFVLKHIAIFILIIFSGIYYFHKPAETVYYSNNRYSRSAPMLASYKSVAMDSAVALNAESSMYVEENSISLSVNNVEKAKDKIDGYAKKAGGRVENLYFNKFYNKTSYTIIYKIPNKEVYNFVEKIKKEGKVNNQNVSITEISQEYKDNEDKLATLNSRKARLEKMLEESKKSNNIGDSLSVERELTSVIDSINRYKKTQKTSDNQVKYATIRLTILPDKYLEFPNGYEWSATDILNKNIVKFIMFTQYLIAIIIKLVVFIPYIALIYVIYRIFKKKNK